jgi:DNA-binding HxlR family transcriptional regulator
MSADSTIGNNDAQASLERSDDARRRKRARRTSGAFLDRWSLIVIRDIMFSDRRHFRALLKEIPEGIASNVLADRLQNLVATGLIARSRDHGDRRKVTYSLTESSIALVPVFIEMGAWERQHFVDDPQTLGAGPPCTWGAAQIRIFMDDLRGRHAVAANTGE